MYLETFFDNAAHHHQKSRLYLELKANLQLPILIAIK